MTVKVLQTKLEQAKDVYTCSVNCKKICGECCSSTVNCLSSHRIPAETFLTRLVEWYDIFVDRPSRC